MILNQTIWQKDGKKSITQSNLGDKADLVIIFGDRELLEGRQILNEIYHTYPKACLIGCSTSGEINNNQVQDDSVVATAIQFERTSIQEAKTHLSEFKNSYEVGRHLGHSLNHENLSHILVLSAGLNVNGSDLVSGLRDGSPREVSISGGLAGDKSRFQKTFVLSGKEISDDMVAVVGFYGKAIKIRSSSKGGWSPFGPERLISRSKSNILYELDGKSALLLYKKYLGEYAKDLPGSALLFPLSIKSKTSDQALVRTILGIDEKAQSMIFAGDIPEGTYCRFMKSNTNLLIEGAIQSAQDCLSPHELKPALAIMFSCVGRKLILKQRVDEVMEGIRDQMGPRTLLTGFYGYGEIGPFSNGEACELHNQTMTITTFSED